MVFLTYGHRTHSKHLALVMTYGVLLICIEQSSRSVRPHGQQFSLSIDRGAALSMAAIGLQSAAPFTSGVDGCVDGGGSDRRTILQYPFDIISRN